MQRFHVPGTIWLGLLLVLGPIVAVQASRYASTLAGISGTGRPTPAVQGQSVRSGSTTGSSSHVRAASAQQQQPGLLETAAGWDHLRQMPSRHPMQHFKVVASHQQRRSLKGNNLLPWAMPGDPTSGEIVLHTYDPMLLQPFAMNGDSSAYEGSSNDHSSSSSSNDDLFSSREDPSSMRGFHYPDSRATASLKLDVVFEPVANFNTSIRLPLPPRTFFATIGDDHTLDKVFCGSTLDLIYKDQSLECTGLLRGSQYTVTLYDTEDTGLSLAQQTYTAVNDGVNAFQLTVPLGMLVLEASFGSLAWAGMYYPKPRNENAAISIHAQIVGAQIVVYTKAAPDLIWDMQWTGDEGTAAFFLVPLAGSYDFIANMSVGDTLLKSMPIDFDNSLSSKAVPQLRQLVAAPQLLCTGEVEDVRGESGTFPSNISALDPARQAVYHPRGFFCRWELLPDYPELMLTVSYAGLLPDESITLYLGPNNVIQLRQPSQPGVGGTFQTTVWVDRSIFVEFQTTRTSTSAVGAFSISWFSSSPGSRSIMDSKTMVVVLACVSAAGAVLAAFCFYCVCCSRRRRGMVVVDGTTTAVAQRVSLLRVPSAVRMLLPSKPYQAPEADNPLPGAATEPDCCSICLIELEPGEHVTVLPCHHFYHKDCIDSWLKRNCTCPLCKSNVLEAFTLSQASNTHQHSRRRHQQHGQAATRRSSSDAATGNSSSSGSGPSSPQERAVAAPSAPAWAAATEIELVAAPAAAAGVDADRLPGSSAAGGAHLPDSDAQGGAVHAAGSAEHAAAAAAGDAVITLTALPRSPSGRPRLPALQHVPATAAAGAGGGLVSTPNCIFSREARCSLDGRHSTDSAEAAAGDGRQQQQQRLEVPALRSPSPAASIGSLQSGTVHTTPGDFAAAAAAAAAALAAETGAAELSPSAALGGAFSAAQASVTAIRSSSRVWGRRLQGLLRVSSTGVEADAADVGAGAATAGAGTAGAGEHHQHTVDALNCPRAAAVAGGDARAGEENLSSRSSSRAPARRGTEVVSPAPGRVAVSIYAYAGHPQTLAAGNYADHEGDEEGLGVSEQGMQQQQQHWGSPRQSAAVSVDGYVMGAAGSSSIAASHSSLARDEGGVGSSSRGQQDGGVMGMHRAVSLPGSTE